MLPDVRDLCKVKLEFLLCLQNTVAFCKGLHQPIFDSVMDHFDEMPRAMWTDMPPAFIWRRSERFKNRTHLFYSLCLTSDHQAVSFRQPPYPAAGPTVDKINPFRFEHGSVTDRIFIIGVASVNDNVTV